MRVLDIDLDFFLADCCEPAPAGARPDAAGHEPWQAEKVREFLEKNCGLNTERKIPGRVFETHDGALQFWQELIAAGQLSVPFEVTHIDAHSDLGIGRPGPGFVLNSVLPLSPAERADIKRYYEMKQLDEANYLLFALAFRWISRLENVRNPKSRPDIPQFAFRCEPENMNSFGFQALFRNFLKQKTALNRGWTSKFLMTTPSFRHRPNMILLRLPFRRAIPLRKPMCL